jgi:hypothetical protein
MANSTERLAPAQLPAVGRLMAYLTTEARFMAQNAAEYGAAAREVVAG